MPDRPQPDPDERFSLAPQTGEEALRKLLGAEGADEDEESPKEGEADS
jgi:hypothetical protein